MKKRIISICALALVFAMISAVSLFGCAKSDRDEALDIMCTVFPLYDWTKNIVQGVENINVSLLVKSGADIHSFQPSFSDMAAIRNSDVVIYVGGESDKWIEESLGEKTVAIKLSELSNMTLYEVSSDSIAQAHTHEDGVECHESHEHKEGFDEHIWLSVKNARTACDAIGKALAELKVSAADSLISNTQRYADSLLPLDARMEALSSNINEPLIFADRFPFVYLFEDYGIDYYAAFDGCTTDTNADFDTVIGLSNRLSAAERKYVFTTEAPNSALSDGVIRESKTQALVISLDSMQSIGAQNMESSSYADIMERNITQLEQIFTPQEN